MLLPATNRVNVVVNLSLASPKWNGALVMVAKKRSRGPSNGLTLVELIVVLGIIAILLALSITAVLAIREASRSTACQNNLRQVALAMLNYESANGYFPNVKPPSFSHFVELMPFYGDEVRYGRIDFQVWPDEPPNSDLLFDRPKVLKCPSEIVHEERQSTSYLGNAGVNWLLGKRGTTGIFLHNEGNRNASWIGDGLSNTISFSEFTYGTESNLMHVVSHPGGATGIDIAKFDQIVRTAIETNESRQLGLLWFSPGLGFTAYSHYLQPGSNSARLEGGPWYAFSPSSNHGKRINSSRADGSVSSVVYAVDRNVWVQLGHCNDGGRTWF